MTARERARVEATHGIQGSDVSTYQIRLCAERAADEASDVWEPIVRALLEHEPWEEISSDVEGASQACFFCCKERYGPGAGQIDTHEENCAWVKAKEALGG